MYAAVRVYEGITDDVEAGRLVRESFLPLLDQVEGFIGYYWIDAGDGAMASLSLFDDKGDFVYREHITLPKGHKGE